MALVPFAVKLARYHAKKKAEARRMARLRKKRREKERLKEVLETAREVLGWKPGGGARSPEHVAALHAGRDRWRQAQREKKAVKKAG